MLVRKIPKAALKRLPVYLHYLKSLSTAETATISSSAIAKALKLGEVQVRKDLAAVSGAGKPKIGYKVEELVSHLEEALGSRKITRAVIVGAGKLGRALLSYEGFPEYGILIAAAFDIDDDKCGRIAAEKQILPMSELPDYCAENDVRIGIITVPEAHAQSVCDKLVQSGVTAIWNFAPASLEVPQSVKLKNENMASSLAVLSAGL